MQNQNTTYSDFYYNGLPIQENFEYQQNTCTGEYLFGFNGKEKVNEIAGEGNDYDFGARIYDSRLGRWLSVDPEFKEYPNFSTYQYCANNPIIFKDINGEKIFIYYNDECGNPQSYEYGSSIKPPDNAFVYQAICALDKIAQSPSMHDKLNFLVETENYDIKIKFEMVSESFPNQWQDKDTKTGVVTTNVRKEQWVNWNDLQGLEEISTGKANAPYINLWHELGHTYDLIDCPDEFMERIDKGNKYPPSSPDFKWGDPEEKFNTQTNEWPISEEGDGFKRQSWRWGNTREFNTKNSTSTEPARPSDP